MLKVDVESLQSIANNGISLAVNQLQSAKISALSIIVPSGFSMADAVRGLPRQIESAIGALSEAKVSVALVAARIANAENTNAQIASQLLGMVGLSGIFGGIKNTLDITSDAGYNWALINAKVQKTKNMSNREYLHEMTYKGFGVNQGMFYNLKQTDNSYYNEMVVKACLKYKMNQSDVIKLFSVLDSSGACSYSCIATNMILKYRNNPGEFEKKYGIPLYRITIDDNGEKGVAINTGEILLDLFVVENLNPGSQAKNVNYLLKRENGKIVFTEGSLETTENGTLKIRTYDPTIYDSDIKDKGHDFGMGMIKTPNSNDYQKATLGIYQNSKTLFQNLKNTANVTTIKENHKGTLSDNDIKDIKKKIKSAMKNGSQLQLTMAPQIFYNENGEIEQEYYWFRKEKLVERGGYDYVCADGPHSVAIVDINDTDIIVDNWGVEMKMSFEDFKKYGHTEIVAVDGL